MFKADLGTKWQAFPEEGSAGKLPLALDGTSVVGTELAVMSSARKTVIRRSTDIRQNTPDPFLLLHGPLLPLLVRVLVQFLRKAQCSSALGSGAWDTGEQSKAASDLAGRIH